MIGIILFLILVLLIYATGLLPGVMKFISGFFALVIVAFSAAAFGWPTVIAGFVAAVALAFIALWLVGRNVNRPIAVKSNHTDIHQQLEKVNKEERQRRNR
ncbi:hypothetical protein ELY33_17210 [Vreelandella andesensis]|uniref:Uncharacterized protein n=1 Tax=Vreelandella andesensis TaxID=447567 RepID=A0A3S0YQG8_9GAMM|nr:hypothetical protein [Halomonas andesensis]RUR26847.1 hypothetical protein ELY33_17210 [Halomonas andesensis]